MTRPLKKLLTAAAMSLLPLWPLTTQAAAPMARTQPGFYRMKLGDFEITALNDGVVSYETRRVLPNAKPEQITSALAQAGLTDPVGMSYNAFLINTGTRLVLIDTGTGGKLDDEPEFHGAGHLLANLRAAGYQPEEIDEVYITHRGQDHIGGLTDAGQRTFVNAVLRAPGAEFELLLNPEKSAALLARAGNNAKVRAWLRFTQELFEPYIKAGKFQSFTADTTLVPGIRTVGTHGHTPGHTSYMVESQGQTLIVMGDLVLMGAMQFGDPDLPSSFDAAPAEAAVQRKRVLQMAVDSNTWIAGSHLSFPGIGHVRSARGRFEWAPVSYMIP